VAEISDELEEEKRNIKLLNGKTKKPEARPNQTENQEKKQFKGEDASSKKHDAPKKPIPPRSQSPEAFFNFGPDDKFTSRELKKRYFELLQKNHPDRVASMSEEFKKLAEKNTKDINKAYDQLKKKAS
jgi:DnaJ-domain-containing protein 1